ncbi:MAG: hypothetical protein ABI068_09790, partial [Ktedonobacterales bacterium]
MSNDDSDDRNITTGDQAIADTPHGEAQPTEGRRRVTPSIHTPHGIHTAHRAPRHPRAQAPSVKAMAAASQVGRHEVIAQVLKEALPYIEALKGRYLVIKLGGSALEHQRDALEDIVWLRGLGAWPVLAHGGGPEITYWLDRLGLPSRFERGLRVTDEATLEVARMALIGKVNGELTQFLMRLGGRAIGISGIDGG